MKHNPVLSAVEVINKKLIDKLKKSSEGYYWETMGLGAESKVSWDTSDSIYCGVSGIALYFLRQYKVCGNTEHLNIAQESLRWCYNYIKHQSHENQAYLTGNMGVAHVMLELNEVAPDKELVKQALEIAGNTGKLIESDWEVCDYINGLAGRIHGLLHIHSKTGNAQLVQLIDKQAAELLNQAWLYKDGLYWDRSGQQVCGLCGLSHGAGGIGYVFMELAKYFNNPALNMIAVQAYRYEDFHYNSKTGNWPDLRRGSFTDAELDANKKEYKLGNRAHFERRNDMNAWCHGSAGIGLVRLEAWKNLKNEKYLKDAKKAIKKTVETDLKADNPKPSYTLCHGGGGNAELFIKAFEITGDKGYLKKAETVVSRALDFYHKHNYYMSGYAPGGAQEDTSLFMGLAGVGYFFLRTDAPDKFPSLLLPSLPEGTKSVSTKGLTFLSKNENQLKQIILSKHFPETIKKTGLKAMDFAEENLAKGFNLNIAELIKSSGDKSLKATFAKEKKAFTFDLAAPSHAWLAIKQLVQMESGETKLNPKSSYKLDEDVQLLALKEGFKMLSRHSKGIQYEEVPQFTYQVLKSFTTPTTAVEVIEEVSKLFGELSKEESKEVFEAIESQIEKALSSGKLVEV